MRIFLFLLALGLLSHSIEGADGQNKVLLIFLDGFRWDYVSCVNMRSNLKGFLHLMNVGASIERMKPVFPADCYPNFYSIFSGHYPNKHGFLFNDLYNSYNGDAFSHEGNSSINDIQRWLKVDMIWDQLKKVGLKSRIFNLPICKERSGNDSHISCIPYNKDKMTIKDFRMSIDQAFDGLIKDDYHFSVVYNDILDKTGHAEGPMSSTILEDLIPKIDQIIYDLLMQMENAGRDDLHLIIVSDHGLAESTQNRPINIERYLLGKNLKQFLNRGTTLSLWSNPESVVEIKQLLEMNNLPLRIYNASTLPNNWKVDSYQHLFPNLYIMADPGYVFKTKYLLSHFPGKVKDLEERKGWHGYSPDHHEMQTPFFVYGPKIERGVRLHYLNPIEIIHVYHLLMNLMNNGYNDVKHYDDHLPSRVLSKSKKSLAPVQKKKPKEMSLEEKLRELLHLDEIPSTIKMTTTLFLVIILLSFIMGSMLTSLLIICYKKFFMTSYETDNILKVPLISDNDQ